MPSMSTHVIRVVELSGVHLGKWYRETDDDEGSVAMKLESISHDVDGGTNLHGTVLQAQLVLEFRADTERVAILTDTPSEQVIR